MNRGELEKNTFISTLFHRLVAVARPANSPAVALNNASAHYDLSNEIFSAFLSEDMTYSCPIWRVPYPFSKLPVGMAEDNDETLETAQMRKITYIIQNARITETDHVLEIGTGWGSFAIEAVRRTNCRITSLTLSLEQKLLAEKRIREAGLSHRITILLSDYRCLPPQRYDKIISVEMVEHVGRSCLATYFRCIDRLLKTDGGIAVLQSSTMPDCRLHEYARRRE